VLPTIVDQYVRPGDVKIVFRSFPFIGDDSIRAAQMAEAMGQQGKMWNFVDIAFRNQGGENAGWVTDELLRDIAASIPGVDAERAMEDRGIGRVQDALEEAQQLIGEFGITGTPSFLIGTDADSLELIDTEQTNPLDVESFSARIDEALQAARR
jgi:protein-disulfide isomerase